MIEDAEWLLSPEAPGVGLDALAQRLGYRSPENLARALYRWGRKDLAELLVYAPLYPRDVNVIPSTRRTPRAVHHKRKRDTIKIKPQNSLGGNSV